MNNRTRLAKITAALLALAPSVAAYAAPSWQPLPPFGGPVAALAAVEGDPLLYAGTDTAGPQSSRNGGATWMPPAQLPGAVRILKLAVDPRDSLAAFAAAGTLTGEEAGVLRTLDGGLHWELANHGLGDDQPLPIEDLAIDPDPFDPHKVYAAAEDGLYLTRDRGASWERIGLDGIPVLTVALDNFRPGVLFASVLQDDQFELLKSTDHGATWTSSSQGIDGHPAFSSILFHPNVPDTLFAFGNGWPTYVSRDGGATWTNLVQPLASLAFGPAGVLLGAPYGTNGVLKSVDGGQSWSRTGALPDRISQLLKVNGRTYAAGGLGVWVSTGVLSDIGAHWEPSSRGLSARTIGDLTESGSVLYGSFAEGARFSGSAGMSWRPLDDGPPEPHILRFLAAGPGTLYAQQSREPYGEAAIVRSTDRGETWTEIATPILGGTFTRFAVDPQHPAVLYAGATENSGNDHPPCHLARSVNGGRTWSCITGEASVDALAVEPETSTPYLITAGSFFVLAGGKHLEYRGTGLPSLTHAFAFDPRRAGALYAATSAGVFKTADGGRSWTRTSQGLPPGAAAYSVAVDPHRKDTVYAGLDGQVYRSLDAGRSWHLLGDGLPTEAPVTTLLPSAANPHHLYAVAAGHGLFRHELEAIR